MGKEKLTKRDVEVISNVGIAKLTMNMRRLYNHLCRKCKLLAVGDLARAGTAGKKLINVNKMCPSCKKKALDFGKAMGVDL